MTPEEYASYDALGLKALLDTGDLSPVELHDIALTAIETLNPTLNFLIASSEKEADRALSELDPQAPFAGVPFFIGM